MKIKNNNIYLGDCLEIMNYIQDKSIDLILCDLPYGSTNCSWDVIIPFNKLWEQYNRIIKQNRAIVLFGTEPFSSHLRLSNLKMYKYDRVWDKVKATGHYNAKKQPMRVHELYSVFYKEQSTYNPQKTKGHVRKTCYRKKENNSELYNKNTKSTYYDSTERYPLSIITVPKETQKSNLHPSQKPVLLLEDIIKTYTNENQLVLDNCMGSGSTCIACINTNRNYIGIEKEEKYFNIAKKRIENHRIK